MEASSEIVGHSFLGAAWEFVNGWQFHRVRCNRVERIHLIIVWVHWCIVLFHELLLRRRRGRKVFIIIYIVVNVFIIFVLVLLNLPLACSIWLLPGLEFLHRSIILIKVFFLGQEISLNALPLHNVVDKESSDGHEAETADDDAYNECHV